MDFLRSIEEDLNQMELETKKKLPAVKDAAEKGIEKIGQIRQLYAQMLRVEAAPGPGNPIFKHDSILRPFLLACNHATASQKLLISSFNSIQKLVSWDAITNEAVGNILRVLQIQAERNGHQDIQLKLLQTLLQLLTLAFNKGDEQMTNDDIISQAIWICLHLQSQSGNTITANTAIMTLRQIVTMVFDNVTTQQEKNDSKLDGAKKVGFLVFQDLCLMSREEAGVWLKRTTFSKILGIELIEAVLTSHGNLFRNDIEFRSMLKQHAKHLIVSNLSPASSFPLLLRIMRLASTVLCQFSGLLEEECNTIWLCLIEIVSTGTFSTNSTGSKSPMFIHMQKRHDGPTPHRSLNNMSSPAPISSSSSSLGQNHTILNYVSWHVLLAMEVIYKACCEPEVMPALSKYPNHLLLVLTRTISAVVTTSPPSDYRPSNHDLPYRCGLEYLNEQEAPPLQPFYNCLRISLLCQYHLITALHSNNSLSPLRLQYILCSLAPFVMNAFHCTLRFCREAELVTMALKSYHMLTDVNAHTRRRIPVEARPIGVLSIQALCVFSFPVPEVNRIVKCITGAGVLTSMEFTDELSEAAEHCLLTWKEMHAMKTLFRTIHTMEQELNELEWRTLLEGFEIIVGLSILKQKTKGVAQRIGTGSSAVKVEDEDVEQQLVMLGQSILEYFQNTSGLKDAALTQILRALRTICYEQINQPIQPCYVSPSATDHTPLVEEELQQLLALWSPDQQSGWDVLSLPFAHHLKTYSSTLGIGSSTTFVPSFSLRMFVQLGKTNIDAWGFVVEELVGFCCLSVPHLIPFQSFATESVFQLVQVALTTMTSLSQKDVGGYILKIIQSDQMKERALIGLLDLLQTSGHLIQDGWPVILQSLGISAEYEARCQVIAFKSLRLIVDDLVASMDSRYRQACISCVGTYATNAKDVNISLTAINELWSLADNIAKKLATNDDELALWPTAFSELKRLALDNRPEVRNCAINTLFGTAVTHGTQFRLVEWTIFLQGTILPLAQELSSIIPEEPSKDIGSVVLHHSRDSVAKQYDESRVLVFSGISRVLQTNTTSLLSHPDWFVLVWRDIISYISTSCDENISKEVVLAAIQTLHTLLQVASTSSNEHVNTPLRAGIGMRIVNGVCTPNTTTENIKKPTLLSRDPQLWSDAFDLLLRLANNDRNYDIYQQQDIASAIVVVFVSIYLQSHETELDDNSKIVEILKIFDRYMYRYVFVNENKNQPVTTNSLHARILNSYEECNYFDEIVHIIMVDQIIGFIEKSSNLNMVFITRHGIQSLGKVYENISFYAQKNTFLKIIEIIKPFLKLKNIILPINITTIEKVNYYLWKYCIKIVIILIKISIKIDDITFLLKLYHLIQNILIPSSIINEDIEYELDILNIFVENIIKIENIILINEFLIILTNNILLNDTKLSNKSIEYLIELSKLSNNNIILQNKCREKLKILFNDTIIIYLNEKLNRNRIILLLNNIPMDFKFILDIFISLCKCITCDDIEIRQLIQNILIQSNIPNLLLNNNI